MKTILSLILLLFSTSAFAVSNLELAGDCKPKVEATLSGLLKTPTAVLAVEDIGANTALLTLGTATAKAPREAVVRLENVRTLARGRIVYVIDCSIVSLNFMR